MSAQKFSLKRYSSGFTLVELLVVVVIIGILTSIAITSFNSFSRAQSIRLATLELKNDLRKVKTDSIAGKKDPKCKADIYKKDGTNGSDKVDDYSLTGDYVTFITHDPASLPPHTYTKGQHCAITIGTGPTLPSYPGYTPAGPNYIIPTNSILTKNISGKTYVKSFHVWQLPGTDCGSFSAVGNQFTVEFYSVNSNPYHLSPYDADIVGFYNGVMPPQPTLPTLWAPFPCTKVDKVVLYLASPESANTCYTISIENNGSIYENKVSCSAS